LFASSAFFVCAQTPVHPDPIVSFFFVVIFVLGNHAVMSPVQSNKGKKNKKKLGTIKQYAIEHP